MWILCSARRCFTCRAYGIKLNYNCNVIIHKNANNNPALSSRVLPFKATAIEFQLLAVWCVCCLLLGINNEMKLLHTDNCQLCAKHFEECEVFLGVGRSSDDSVEEWCLK